MQTPQSRTAACRAQRDTIGVEALNGQRLDNNGTDENSNHLPPGSAEPG
jgi:hypothetical protein